uniref:Nitroreductase domain-containing protein n=1 Tax=Parascaris univalens TaxID=6257 RepID=A0A915AU68_PARUN
AVGLIRTLIYHIDQTHVNAFCAIAVTLFVLLQLRSLFHKKESPRQKLVGDNDDILCDYENIDVSKEVLYRAVTISDDEAMLKSQLFYEKMKRRRSVRSFSTRPVSPKLILNLIKTAGTAPSGANLQPWTFCVIGKSDIKSRIRAIVEAEEQINYSRRMGARWVLDVAHLKLNWCKPYLTEAPFLIVIMKQTYQIDANGERHPTYYNEISVSIAAECRFGYCDNNSSQRGTFNSRFAEPAKKRKSFTSITGWISGRWCYSSGHQTKGRGGNYTILLTDRLLD